MTVKTALSFAGAFVAGVGLMLTVHAQMTLPAILHETGKQTDDKIANHLRNPHPGAVDQSALASLQKTFDLQLDAIKNLVDKITTKEAHQALVDRVARIERQIGGG